MPTFGVWRSSPPAAHTETDETETEKNCPVTEAVKIRAYHSGGIETYVVENCTSKRMIHGIASTPRHSTSARKGANPQSLSPKGIFVQFPLKIFSEHTRSTRVSENVPAIGEIVMLQIRPQNVYVKGIIYENSDAADFAWALVERGETLCFSVLSQVQQLGGVVDGVEFVKHWRCKEISICRQGANPDCVFEIYKSGDRASEIERLKAASRAPAESSASAERKPVFLSRAGYQTKSFD